MESFYPVSTKKAAFFSLHQAIMWVHQCCYTSTPTHSGATMTEVLPKKVCWRAASLHLAGLIWIPICLATYVPIFWISNQIWNVISGTLPSQGSPGAREWTISIISFLFTIPTVSIVLAMILLFLIWKINREPHSFIDLAGRSTMNIFLSIILYYLILFLLGIMMPILHFFGLTILLALLPPFAHSIFAISGAEAAGKGQAYRSPITIKFFK
jgi:uncharacterized Tic20 family protein